MFSLFGWGRANSEREGDVVDFNMGALMGDIFLAGDRSGMLRKEDDIFQLGVGELIMLLLAPVMSARTPLVVTARSRRGRLADRFKGLSL